MAELSDKFSKRVIKLITNKGENMTESEKERIMAMHKERLEELKKKWPGLYEYGGKYNPVYIDIDDRLECHNNTSKQDNDKLDVTGAIPTNSTDIDALTELVLEEIKYRKEKLTNAETIVKLIKDCPTDALISIKGLIESILIDRKK